MAITPFPAYRGDEPYIFVCYAHEDAAVVYPDIKALNELGFNLWYDEGISPGTVWRHELAQVIKACDLMLVYISPRSVTSENCLKEINFGLDEARQFLAVHVEPTELPDLLRFGLSDRQAVLRHRLSKAEYRRKMHEALRAAFTEVEVAAPAPVEASRAIGSIPRVLLIALAVVAVSLGVYFSTTNEIESLEPAPAGLESLADVSQPIPGSSGRPAIAILPFQSMSDDPEQQHFADGLTDELITNLQRYRDLPVISRNSTFAYQGTTFDKPRIARELGVGYLLEGRVRSAGEDLRVNVQLTDATGKQVWAERYEGPLADIFEVQDDITSQIVGALWPQYLESEIDRAIGAQNVDAWSYFLRGVSYAFAHDPSNFDYAVGQLDKAIALDPNIAQAYWARGVLMQAKYMTDYMPPEQALEKEEEILGYYRKAMEISPAEVSACGCLGYLLTLQGKLEEARAVFEVGLEVNPLSAELQRDYATFLLHTGELEAAHAAIDLSLRLNPVGPTAAQPLVEKAMILLKEGDLDDALHALRISVVHSPNDPLTVAPLTVMLYLAGHREEAATTLRGLLELYPRLTPRNRFLSDTWRPLEDVLRIRLVDDYPSSTDTVSYGDMIEFIYRQSGWREPQAAES